MADDSLHRLDAHTTMQWHGVPAEDQNTWQKLAHKTHGIVTPGNITTVLGAIMVLYGIKVFIDGSQMFGIMYVFAGRVCDVLDGYIAHATQTKSLLGATLDESIDMVLLVVALVALSVSGAIPLLAAAAMAVPKSGNVAAWVAGKLRNKRAYPTRASKIGTAFMWAAIGAFMYNTLLVGTVGADIELLGWALTVVALVLTVPSTLYYLSIGFGSRVQEL